MGEHHYYCRKCGTTLFPTHTKCLKCDSVGTLTYSKYDCEYYRRKSLEEYGDYTHWKKILLDEEIKNDPLFDAALCYTPESKEHYQKRMDELHERMLAATLANTNPNIPQCPTCGSTNVKKISAVKRGVHMGLFGVFSRTSFSQFECNNCGYQW